MYKVSAPLIFPVSSEPLVDHVVVYDNEGKILDISHVSKHDKSEVNMVPGALIPGLINTHCHLELSHMKGMVDTGTTLIPFIESVVSQREVDQELIDQAIKDGDQEMFDAGIVAVGDICNKIDTLKTKDNSDINYYSFVEMFDFMQSKNALTTFNGYMEVYRDQSTANGNKKSVVPHAPYSVSDDLFKMMVEINGPNPTVSIHNQETPLENEYFKNKSGKLVDLFSKFNLDMEFFNPTNQTSIYNAIKNLSDQNPTLFVHNTTTSNEDLKYANNWNKNCFWATCANANLYIENRLPDYHIFLESDAKVTIGTDSLTSNWQLSVLEEMATILKYCSYVKFETALQWATINGAQALQFSNKLGSFEINKTPGILQVNVVKNRGGYKLENTKVNRII